MHLRLIEKQVVFNGKKVRLEVDHLEDVDTGRRVHREMVIHNGAVVVLPLLKDGHILMIRQRRYTVNQVLLELPAGTLEKGEDPINCGGRELQEETGYLAGRLEAITSFFSSPGIMTEKMYVYVAYDLEKSVSALEEGEEIELMPVAYDDAIRMCGDGRITDGKTLVALLMYDRFRRATKLTEPGTTPVG